MAPFKLSAEITFLSPLLADEDGLLAFGGDLQPARLIAAYRYGIFPWYSQGDPILWWFTHPRLVLFLNTFTVSRRLARDIRKQRFTVTFDREFSLVMRSCAQVRVEKGEATWISPEMHEAYCRLHELGYAHSVECWQGETLAGGLYGIALGRIFWRIDVHPGQQWFQGCLGSPGWSVECGGVSTYRLSDDHSSSVKLWSPGNIWDRISWAAQFFYSNNCS